MNEEATVVEATTVAPAVVNLEDKLAAVSAELTQVKAQLKQVEEQAIENQKQLQAAKDRLLSRGLELQGQERLLNELLNKPVAK